MKKILVLFILINIFAYGQWVTKKTQTNDNMTSTLIEENETKSSGLIIISSNFDGNLSLVYVANLALNKLDNPKVEGEFNYGYSKDENIYIAIKTVPNGIVTIENTSEDNLLKSISYFNESSLNIK